MNRKILTLAIPLILNPLTVFALNELTPGSQIESVSLFKDGALVTRTATLDIPAGKSTITIDSLPSTAQQDALQASLADTTSGVVRNATLYIPRETDEPQNVEDLRTKLKELEHSIKEQEQLKQLANRERNFANKISSSFSDKFGIISDGDPLTIDQAKQTWEYTQSIISKSNQSIKNADDQIHDIQEDIKDLQKELTDALETFGKLRSIASIEVEFEQAVNTEISISYIVTNAHWQPRYELRATPSDKSLDFGYFASIHQSTGEDWENIDLSLHTNQVNRRGNVPELYPLVVNKDEPRYSKMRSMRVSNDMAAPALESSLEMEPMYSTTNTIAGSHIERDVSVSSSTVSFQFKLPGKPSIPSADEFKTLPVIEKQFTTKYWSEVVPRAQLDAYLIGETTNQLDIPILPGQALAFVDGKLSSKVYLQKTLPQEELKLSLGTDANIVVKRREGASQDASTGFIDKTTTLKREYVNEVANYHNIAHDVVVIDQFPLSRNSKIEIKRISPEEDEVEFDEDREGVFQWKRSVPSKETVSFTTNFEVVYPRDWDISPQL